VVEINVALRYTLKLVILDPFAAGKVHVSGAEVVVGGEVRESTGAPGAPRGVPLAVVRVEEPEEFTAATANAYGVPLSSPVIEVGETSGDPGVHSIHVVEAEGR
jgi:hypothetical protein